jgi:hypothetical protein
VSEFLFVWRGPLTTKRHRGSLIFPDLTLQILAVTLVPPISLFTKGDGGETVFTEGWPPGDGDRVEFEEAQAALRKSGDTAGILEEGSWEENMVVRCRSRLSIRPHSSRAVLFYSQNPDGTPDQKSLHGGCPVISGQKWAASEWHIRLTSASMYFVSNVTNNLSFLPLFSYSQIFGYGTVPEEDSLVVQRIKTLWNGTERQEKRRITTRSKHRSSIPKRTKP